MRLLSDAHAAAVISVLAGAVAAVVVARRAGPARVQLVCRALAAAIGAGYVGEHLAYALRGEWTARVNLPLQLTDVIALVSVAALLRPQRGLLAELLYFWGLTASVAAIATPDLGETFPDPLYLTFFVTHGGAVVAACLLCFGLGLLPRSGALWRVWGATLAAAAAAAVGTLITGGNYLFLRRRPANDSLLDVLGPWPWYLVACAALAFALFAALAGLARALTRCGWAAT